MNLATTRFERGSLTFQQIDSFQPQADTWVKLRERPDDYSDDEALLLCETETGSWLAWVAGFGAIELQPGEFYRII